MIAIRNANERGHANHGWLNSFHTFSFADYYDPAHMGFRNLRVINEDTVEAGRGFGTHGHRDMEIISYVLDGSLQHKDSMGTGSVIRPGDVQRMTAGTGVMHSEVNGSRTEPVHFLQIWLLPAEPGLTPGYEQKTFAEADKDGKLRVVAAPDGRDGAVTLHADATLYAGRFGRGQSAAVPLARNRHGYVHVARGGLTVNGQALGPGDGLALTDEAHVRLEGTGEPAEVLVFDLG